jgi:hypothetical protein
VAQDKVHWWNIVNNITNHQAPKRQGISRPTKEASASQLLSFSRGILLHGAELDEEQILQFWQQ